MTQGPEVDAAPTRPRAANYAARRMLVSSVAVALVVIAIVAVRQFTRDDTEAEADGSAAWSQVVLVDRITGAVTAVAPDEPTERAAQASASGRVIAVHVEGDRIALVQTGQIALTALDGTVPTIVPTALGAVVTRLPVPDALWLAVGSSSGGNVQLVDGLTATVIDVGALTGQPEPRYFVDTIRVDATGDTIAIADAGAFQTIVVNTAADPPTAAFYPDIPIAVTPDRVLTSQVVGQQADFSLRDADQQSLANVTGELPAAGAIDGDDVVVVSTEGTVSRFGRDDTEAERLGEVTVPPAANIRWVRTTANGTRFVVFGDVFEAVVGLDGRTLFTTTFATAVEAPTVEPDWACLPVGGGDTYHSIVDLETGDVLADLTGLAVVDVADDGCTVLATRTGVTSVIGRDGALDLGPTATAVIAPDGRAAVITDAAGSTRLIGFGDGEFDELDEPIDLTSLTPPSAIVTFRTG